MSDFLALRFGSAWPENFRNPTIDLRQANLRRAHLDHADLRHAHLRDADLRETTLRYADLRGANLARVRLDRADLTDVQTDDTTIWPPAYSRAPHAGKTAGASVAQAPDPTAETEAPE